MVIIFQESIARLVLHSLWTRNFERRSLVNWRTLLSFGLETGIYSLRHLTSVVIIYWNAATVFEIDGIRVHQIDIFHVHHAIFFGKSIRLPPSFFDAFCRLRLWIISLVLFLLFNESLLLLNIIAVNRRENLSLTVRVDRRVVHCLDHHRWFKGILHGTNRCLL